MKGIVFTEFLEMVEDRFGPAVADRVITLSGVKSDGVYTSVGTYDHQELVAMVGQLAIETGTPADALVREFGRHLFGRFSTLFPQFFVGVHSAFDFLRNVDQYIHPEVRKLYPDAELPRFDSRVFDAERMELVYRSSRQFADLAQGLMEGCFAHFGERFEICRESLASSDPSKTEIRFVLKRTAVPRENAA